MKSKWIPVLFVALLLTSCKPPANPEPTNTPTEIPTPTETQPPKKDSIIVNTTSDRGAGSLRQALLDARYGTTISFDPEIFPPDDPATIYVEGQELPHINAGNLILDASNAGVILDGSHLNGEWIAGLQIASSSTNLIRGFQVRNFPGPGIAISGSSTQNTIGGNRSTGSGPWGQGNLLTNNKQGINIASRGCEDNTVTGNLIGTDLTRNHWLGNNGYGIQIFESARNNIIGPDNIIAYNTRDGIYIDPPLRADNTVIGNQLFGNAIGVGLPLPPAIFDFDLTAGTASGASCPDCMVEIYSSSSYEEGLEDAVFEGEVAASKEGVFNIAKGEPFHGPFLTARTTNLRGRTSWLAYPLTSGTENNLVIQTGNELPRQLYLLEYPPELADNHLASQYDGIGFTEDRSDFTYIYRAGMTRARLSIAGMEPELVDWNKPEFSISQAQREHFTRLKENDILVTYVLIFWDKENYPGGEGLPCARFQTEEEIESWLEYVRFTVEELGDYVDIFEIWNEPNIQYYCPKWIILDDYINLIKRTAPVIREADPDARIAVGAVSGTYYAQSQNYLFGILESDVMPLIDVISFHPLYGESPKYSSHRAYYNNYPDFLQRIMDKATTNGFSGEYHADEVGWTMQPGGGQSGEFSLTETNKYFLRAVMLHRGMGVNLGLRGGYYTIRRVAALMAGAEPSELPVEIDSQATDLMSFPFLTLGGDRLIAVWTNGIAVEDDPGREGTIIVPDFSASEVTVIDLLNNLEQELVFSNVEGDLVIENLLIRDYPLVIKVSGGGT